MSQPHGVNVDDALITSQFKSTLSRNVGGDQLFPCVLCRSPPKPQIVPPPPDVQPIIDRMAMYVAKNGVEFELVVKSKRDQRFAFLEPGHVHFQYYDFKKNMFLKVRTQWL